MKSLLFIVAAFVCLSASAMKKGGVSFKDRMKYNKQKLVLNGLGIREATVFNVDVYVAGIYLPKKTTDANEIIKSNVPKVLKMKFVREVSAEKINSAWDESLGNKGMDAELSKLKSATKDLKEGDQMVFTFGKTGKTTFYFNKKRVARFNSQKFSKALLAVWFGANPPNSGLKTGMLGL